MQIKKNRLTLYEREKIEYYLKLKLGKREIGRRIKRTHSDIIREIKRNSNPDGSYSAVNAQLRTDRRQAKKKGRKLDKDKDLLNYVISEIKESISPEIIAGRLKNQTELVLKKYPELKDKSISHESIYDYIYNGEGRFQRLFMFLPYKRKKRQKQKSRKSQRKTTILKKVSIALRPGIVSEKKLFGNFESDSMLFSTGKECLSVQKEMLFQKVHIHRLKNKSAEETEEALRKTIEEYAIHDLKTITFDNGTENANHHKIEKDFGIDTYFCDPYCAWQKGSVENINRMIRRFFPRKRKLSAVSDEEISWVENYLNNLPRKSLNYLSPNEAYAQYLSTGVVHF